MIIKIEPGIVYSTSEPEYIGSKPIRIELGVLPADPTVKGWKVEEVISVDGNKYLRLLAAYLKKVGKESEDDLTEEEIEKLYSKCEDRWIGKLLNKILG